MQGRPGCNQRPLDEITISRLKCIKAQLLQGSNQLGQCCAELRFVLAHQLARVLTYASATSVCGVVAPWALLLSARSTSTPTAEKLRA